jgi:beta-mannosidase
MKKILLALIALSSMHTADAQVQYPNTPIRNAIVAPNWEFRQAGTADWKPTQVPVSVHTALFKNGLIDDPFYRDNEEKLQWVERQDWEFQTTFDASPEVLARKHIELVFKGLDTYAQVYLNDTLVLETENMFRTWKADVKRWLKPTGNRLHIYFQSPLNKTDTAWKALGYELPGGQRTMTRKAQFHYGWDWGPRFVGCGILKMPEIVAWDDILIENLLLTTQKLEEGRAVVVARFRYRSDAKLPVTVFVQTARSRSVEERVFEAGVHEDSATFDIPNPRLWWCKGMGEPHLYDLNVELRVGRRTVERMDARMGIRSIELVTEKDEKGESFYFKLNGKRVFAKGANYIPQDIFQDRVTPERYKRLLDDVAAANMNMLRVWGGGIYEDEAFYRGCDERGILVWQDFMYACALYPGNGSFLKNAAREALEQIERLRQHPCIALWCGNNENNEAWHMWGWQMQFNEAQRTQLWRDYQILFNELLPTYVLNNADNVPYWESSPRFGRRNPKSNTEGDSHYWGVWIDEEPIEIYNKKVPRFMSEYGFQSFPDWRTVEAFTAPEDRQLDSKVMLVHQKFPRGNALMAEYMRRDYQKPDKFEDFVYLSQVVQAEAIRTGIEAHRRNKPYCMGTLYWQLNDVWPVASWSSVDYFGRWKALHYQVRAAFEPVVALPIVDDGKLKIYGSNDGAVAQKVALSVRTFDFSGKKLGEASASELEITPDSSVVLWENPLKNLLNGSKAENSVVVIQLADSAGAVLDRRLFYATTPRKMDLPKAKISITNAEKTEGGYTLSLQADGKLAKSVHLQASEEGFFADNFFDLLPGERRSVFFKTDRALTEPLKVFRAKSLVDVLE